MLFDVASMPDYGQLSRPQSRRPAGRRPHRRRRAQEEPRRFRAVEAAPADEPGWDSPVGQRGRPGWHIECSAMSERLSRRGLRHPRRRPRPHLPAPRERDRPVALRPRHATSWPTSGCTTASCRSRARRCRRAEGNFVTINELLETEKFGGRKWPGEVLRLAMLMTHYREPIDFTVRRLEEAEEKLAQLAARAIAPSGASSVAGGVVVAALTDDLKLPPAIAQMPSASPSMAKGGTDRAVRTPTQDHGAARVSRLPSVLEQAWLQTKRRAPS